jgi:hypothetical protein
MSKPLKLKKTQIIGGGYWSRIFRVSPRRIIKVFRHNTRELDGLSEKVLVSSEVYGARKYKYALPVLKVIDVITPEGYLQKGIVKKYLPHCVRSMKQLWELYPTGRTPWDYDGTIYLVDTQHSRIFRQSFDIEEFQDAT